MGNAGKEYPGVKHDRDNKKELEKAFFGDIEGEKLKSAPKGFPKDHPDIELLKMKSYLVSRLFSDREITSKGVFDLIIKGCRAMKPLNDFLNDF